jgi:hypothetical protein
LVLGGLGLQEQDAPGGARIACTVTRCSVLWVAWT